MSTTREIFRVVTIDGKPLPYMVTNLGRVYSNKRRRFLVGIKLESGAIQMSLMLERGGAMRSIMLHILVSTHFKKHEVGQNSALHLNYVNEDNRAKNLKPCTHGQRGARTRVHNASQKQKLRGVYKLEVEKHGNKYKYFRAMIKDENGKLKTIGYFKHKKTAYLAFKKAYVARWGVEPY